ncbi:MAG: beta strand repeat-containing protein [Myxococcota bacterium]
MVRWNMMRMAVAVAAVALVGCNCDKPEVTCTDTEISWEAPTSDTTTSPFDVSFSVKASGNPFSIDKAQITIDGKTVVGTVSGARATFSGVTSSAGEQQLVATISQGTCSKTYAPRAITVQGEMCTTPAVSAVTFPQDTAAPMGVLNGTELPPGEHVQVRVAASCSTGVQVRIKRGADVVSELTDFSAGVAVVTTTLPDGDNARYDLFAELVKNGAAVNTTASNPEASASIEVARTPPVVALTVPPVFGPMDDANSGMAGFQARVPGTAPAGTTCTLAVTTQTPQTVVATMSGDVSADFTLTSGSYTATLTCTDPAGNVGTAMATFRVDFEPPMVTIISPANVDGGATMIVTQSPLSVTISTDAEDGSDVAITRNGTEVDADRVSGGAATLTVSFGADGTYTLAVTVTDLAGNSTTRTVVVVVTLDGCGAAFTRPPVCPVLITPAQMSNGTYSFQTASKPTCQGQPATLYRIDYLADGGALAEVPSGSTTVGPTGVSNFPPVTLTSGDYAFRAEIVNLGADAGVSVADSCRVTVDLDGPVITNPIVPGGSPYAIVNASQDTQPLVPGVQRTLTFSARVPMGGRVDVCTTQPFDSSRPASDGGFEMRPTSAECGPGWYVLQQGVTSPVSGFTFPDGTYDIKVVVVGGGQAVASPPVSMLSDSIRPCVNGISRTLPQDANSNNRLSIVELGGAAPRLQFQLGCGDTASSLSATTPVTVRDVTGGAAGATRASTAAFASNTYTVTLTGAYATELDLNLFVELTDLAGNKNLLNLPVDPATFSFRVDPVAPTCDIQSPGPSQTLIGQAGVMGGMFPVSVSTSPDVTTNSVRVTFGTTAARDLTPTNNVAQTSYAVSGTNTYAVTAVCTDESGNQTTATPRSVTIDLDAPTCSISSPAAMTYSVNQISTAVSVAGAEGRTVTIRSSLQGAPLGTLTVGSGVATGNISYPNGTQTVTAEVSDTAGNPCSASVAGVVVNSTSCGLTLTNVFTNSAGNWFNRSNTGSLGATTGVIASVNANSADCRSGQTVTLQRTLPTMGAVATTATPSNGDVSFANVSVNDGETWTMTINNGTGILTTQTFRVGLRVPTATGVTINGNALTTGQDLFFVAASGNINLEPSAGTPKTTTYFADGVPGTAGSQTNVAVTGINGTRIGADNGLVEVRYASGAVVSQPVTSEPFDLPSTQMSLTHNTTGTFVVRLTSAAGNTVDVISSNAAVDVLAPAAPSVTQTLASARAATVNLSWSPVYDDGSDSSSGGLTGGPISQLAGYDVRWTTSSVPSNNAMAAVADYFGSSSKQDGITAWSANPINKALSVPPINTYFIGVRARDEVGNYSTFGAPVGLANSPTVLTLTGTAGTAFGQTVVSSASLNSDSIRDVIVSAPTTSGGGAVYVYFGSSTFSGQSGCGAGCQALIPSDTSAGQFGSDIGVGGNLGDVAAENKPDLVVGQVLTAGGNNGGRVVIYFGTASGSTLDTSQAIELRGSSTERIGFTTKLIRDLNGDGLDEVAIAVPFWSGGGVTSQGRIYIYRGRSRAAWAAARTATDPVSMVPYIPVGTATADFVIDGPLSGGTTLSTGGNSFGQRRTGMDSVGEAVPSGSGSVSNLVVPMSRPAINSMRVYSGSAIAASTPAAPLSGGAQTAEFSLAPVADTSFNNGLGVSLVGGLNILDSATKDIVVTYPNTGRVFILTSLVGPTLNPAVTIQGPGTFGFSVSAGNVSSDSLADIVVGQGATSGNFVWIVYQQGGSLPFENMSGGQTPFYFSQLDGTVLVGQATNRFGWYTAVGDVTGDGVSEVLIGDETTAVVKVLQ